MAAPDTNRMNSGATLADAVTIARHALEVADVITVLVFVHGFVVTATHVPGRAIPAPVDNLEINSLKLAEREGFASEGRGRRPEAH